MRIWMNVFFQNSFQYIYNALKKQLTRQKPTAHSNTEIIKFNIYHFISLQSLFEFWNLHSFARIELMFVLLSHEVVDILYTVSLLVSCVPLDNSLHLS